MSMLTRHHGAHVCIRPVRRWCISQLRVDPHMRVADRQQITKRYGLSVSPLDRPLGGQVAIEHIVRDLTDGAHGDIVSGAVELHEAEEPKRCAA
jgi:hypothetical protein